MHKKKMLRPLHPARKKILDALREYESVTYRELMAVTNISSPSVIYFHLQKLMKLGFVERIEPQKYRVSKSAGEHEWKV